MRRSPNATRYYLGVPATDSLRQWPEDALRSELDTRLDIASGSETAHFTTVDTLHLRVQVTSPRQHDRVFRAGDAPT